MSAWLEQLLVNMCFSFGTESRIRELEKRIAEQRKLKEAQRRQQSNEGHKLNAAKIEAPKSTSQSRHNGLRGPPELSWMEKTFGTPVPASKRVLSTTKSSQAPTRDVFGDSTTRGAWVRPSRRASRTSSSEQFVSTIRSVFHEDRAVRG